MRTLRWLVIIGGVLLAVLLLASSFIGPFGWGRGYGGYGWVIGPGITIGFGFPFLVMVGLGMLVCCVFMLGGGAWPMQSLGRGPGSSWIPPQNDWLLSILETQYSRGEITKEQFETMKRNLEL